MNKRWLLLMLPLLLLLAMAWPRAADSSLHKLYLERIADFKGEQSHLLTAISAADLTQPSDKEKIIAQIALTRRKLKRIDFWLRYYEPIAYKLLNGPLPVEWETEVHEKFEKPYKREGAGLTLAELYLQEEKPHKDSLRKLIERSVTAMAPYAADSITSQLDEHHTFFLCNRLYLLNLATIYTTGFECPAPSRIIPELLTMLVDGKQIYQAYNETFPQYALTQEYDALYKATILFVQGQSQDFTQFDHFTFVQEYVNPLFALNQQMIRDYKVMTGSYVDYALSNEAISIFDKSLFFAQNQKGVYSKVKEPSALRDLDSVGKLLFYDPILSGNNRRSCASCHKPKQFFTDTLVQTAMQFDGVQRLPRNTPSLLNVIYNHLLMLDGKELDLQAQAKTVLTNSMEMSGAQMDILNKVLSCPTYKKAFKRFLRYTPQYKEITLEHITSAITLYYGKFSQYEAPFDRAMNKMAALDGPAIQGYNLFMGKAQCGTCHFAPTFSGIKPPYVGNEFEVIGTTTDSTFHTLSSDLGRYEAHAAAETRHAFRTPTLRNAAHTAPYMHNGSLRTLTAVMEFYEGGGGLGRNLPISNQTLSTDSLHLSALEKQQLIAFVRSLSENIIFEEPPVSLPPSSDKALNARKVGGDY